MRDDATGLQRSDTADEMMDNEQSLEAAQVLQQVAAGDVRCLGQPPRAEQSPRCSQCGMRWQSRDCRLNDAP